MIYRRVKELNDEDMLKIRSIYRHPLVSRFISIDEDNYWRYVTTTDNVYFFKIIKDGIFVATIHLELINYVLYMSVVVFPEYQEKGIAGEILCDIQSGKLGVDFIKIRVSVDERNIASIKLFENAGFVCVGKEKELLEYEYCKS